MKKSEKKETKRSTPAAAEQPGTQVVGPGVLKRPRREPGTEPAPQDVANYAPSEQVFRRR